MTVPQALAIGIGAPVLTGVLSGLIAKKEDARAYWRLFGIAAVSTLATVTLVSYFMPAAVAEAVPCPPVRRSVSDVTVQLGRAGLGIKAPGQIRGIVGPTTAYGTSLILVD